MPAGQGFHLSPQQQRLWRFQQTSAAYTGCCALELDGDLDAERLADALAVVAARHEILRTTFALPPSFSIPLQVIAEQCAPLMLQLDRTADAAALRDSGDARDGWDELIEATALEQPFPAAEGPLLRAVVVRLAAQRHGLILSLPALCADHRSLLNIADELLDTYAGKRLDPVGMQYADYAAWLNEQLEDASAVAGRAHWRGCDLGAIGEARLPGERPASVCFAPTVYAETWPLQRWAEIAAAARAGGVSPAAWLLTLWQALLGRLAGCATVTVGALCEGREFEELRGAVGPYARYLPATAASGQTSVRDLAMALEATLADAREWQDYFAWDEPAGSGAPQTGATTGGFFPFCFELAELPPPRRAADLVMRVVRLAVCGDRFGARLGCSVTADGLRIDLAYDPACFDAADAARLVEQWRVLLGGALLAPAASVRELPLLSPAARHQVLIAWNDTQLSGATAAVAVHELFARQAADTPERVAIEAAGRTLTYAELAQRAGALAGRLRSLGVRPEVVVGLFVERSPEMVIALLAVLAAGGAYLPLDPELPRQRLAFMLEDSGAALVLTHGAQESALPPSAARIVRLDEEISASTAPAAWATLEDQLAYVIYTSGSTGRPKGILISHRSLANYLCWSADVYVAGAAGAAGSEGVPLHSPLAFDLTVTGLFLPLLSGRRVTLVPEQLGLDGLADALRRDREYSFVKLTPAHLEVLKHQLGDGVATVRAVRCRALVLGGEALLASHVAWWMERAPAARVFNEYGPTEATVGCCVHELRAAALGSQRVPIGRPIASMRLHVVDEHLEPVPVGVTGELVIGGAGLARGYLGRSALTADRFVPDPHATVAGERLYRTGDLARYRRDGVLDFLGRRDHQVKLRGYRIELGEIEAVLRQHPAVHEAAVLVDMEPAGQLRLCACFSGDPGAGGTGGIGDITQWLESQLPAYMVPHVFIGLEALPLTPNGKVDRSALGALVRRREDARRRPYRPPRTQRERILAEIWGELLPVDRVGLDDNFFQLGGDSIVSLQVLGRASRRGLRLTTRQIFNHPILLELAAVATEAKAASTEQGLVTGPIPLTPIQRAFFATPDPAPHHYDFATLLLRLERPLATARLASAVGVVWRHHDALRLRFRSADGAWTQENAGLIGPGPFTVLDLAALPATVRQAALDAAAARLAASFDLASGPLARWVLIRLGDADLPAASCLLILLHHLVTDAVSLRILLEDFETACQGATAGTPLELPPKRTSFRRWAECLSEVADSAQLREELAYWLAPRRRDACRLPLDGMARHKTVAWSAECQQELDADSTRALVQEVPRAYHTEIGDILLTALALTLNRHCGGPVVVDLEGHGREELFADIDLTRTVGWFTSLYPVLLDLPAGAGRRAALMAVKEDLRRLPRHGVGYGLLRYLCSDGSVRQGLADMPAAEVSFNYLGQLDAGRGSAAACGFFKPVRDFAVAPQGLLRARAYWLEINAWIDDGRLRVAWRYDREAHRTTTVEELGARFLAELCGLVAHCRSRELGTHTPSDFALARLDQARLDELTATYGEVADLYPVAPMQESMLLHTLAFPASEVGFDRTVLRLRGPVDAAVLRRAWQRLAERHAVLRTCFAWRGTEAALQVVLRAVEPPWTEVDLSALPLDEPLAAYRELLAADRRGFDLARAPLLRLLLVRLGAGESRLVWSRHHVLLDGWSTAIVVSELETLYRALCRRCPEREPELPRCHPYRDYIAWLAGQDPARTAAYWRRLLAGVTAPTPLPVERSARRGRPSAARWVARSLPVGLGADLRQLCARGSLTVNVLLQAAWACLLSRYSGESDVVFGSTVAGRPADLPGVETIVGLFIKNLPVRVRCTPDRPVLELLRELQREQIELREHEAVSPIDVQPWSDVPGYLPLFESLVVVANYPFANAAALSWEVGAGGALEGEEGSAAPVGTAYPLTLVVDPAERPALVLVHDGDRFEGTAGRRMLVHLESLLRGMVEDPDRTVSSLPLLSDGERHQLLREWGWDAAGEQWLILDPRRQPVPLGVVGELFHALPDGPPEATGEAAAHRADGGIDPLGRRDRLVRVQGRSVDLRRLEEVLGEHPSISAAAAVVRDDDAARDGPRLVAYVETAGGAARLAGELRGYLRRHWSAGAQPSELVFLPSLPRRPDGSVDYAGLPSPQAQRLSAELDEEILGADRDLVEAQLVRLWEDVLGIGPIGRDDDFFALGGTSISALRLASRLRQDLGSDLPLAVFFRAATVRSLAAQLRTATASTSWSPLVAIRPGGAKRPFFCVHPVGGNVLCFVDLARRLDPERPFYGLQAAGLGGGQKPHGRLAEMAAHYLEEIRRVQPRGPYSLGGLSFGGHVAFEMAQQLLGDGEEVALLAVLDTASPLYRGAPTSSIDAAAALAFQAGFMAEAAGASIDIDAGQLRRLDDAEQIDVVVNRLLGTAGAMRDLGEEHLRRVLALYQSHARCLASYQPRPYRGRITVFRAREEHRVLEAMLQHPAQREPDYGWGELTAEPIEVRWVPGSHSTMIYEPHVASLAAELDAALGAADSVLAPATAAALHE
jgi:amino acid adenylation domain-containing protein/non-ribosomal peptide synthase protein (TIGR01720 family)